jgi:CRP-like cAMP-binding protein
MPEPVTSRIEREIFFRAFAHTARPPEAVVRQFVDSLSEQQLPRGAILFRAGDPADFIYNLMRGALELRHPSGRAAPWHYGAPSIIGVLDALQGQPYSRTAVALDDSVLLGLRSDDYFEILEDNFEFTKVLLGVLYRHAEGLSRPLDPDVVYPDHGCEQSDAKRLAQAQNLDLVERVLVLRSAAPLRAIRLQVLVRLAQLATELTLLPGEPLWSPGQAAGAFWFVARGSVIARRDDPPLHAHFGSGTMVLPLAALAAVEPLYRAVAGEPTLVLTLRKEDLWDVMEDHSDVTRALLAHAAGEQARLLTVSAGLAEPAIEGASLAVPP